jgi:hypothetical protein
MVNNIKHCVTEPNLRRRGGVSSNFSRGHLLLFVTLCAGLKGRKICLNHDNLMNQT